MVVRFDLTAPATIIDPYPMFRATRDKSPVRLKHRGSGELRAVLSYEQVNDVLRDHDRFSSAGFGEFGSDLFRLVLINDDPPRHTRLRRLVNQSFSRRAISELEPWIEETITSMLTHIENREADFVSGLAKPLPIRVIAMLLGIPNDDIPDFDTWLNSLMHPAAKSAEARETNVREMVDYFEELISTRRARPLDDLISRVTKEAADGDMFTDFEILGYAILLLVAGSESTTCLLSNAVNILANNEHLWSQLQSSPELTAEFVEETIRFESPVQLLPRRATEDVQMNGKTIPKGAIIFVQYGSANRDPRAFSQPDEFRLDRNLRNHLGFGAGIHFCLGSPLARAEARLLLRIMLRRYEHIEVTGAAKRQTASAGFLGFESLPLRLVNS